jgi:ferredoxin
MNVKIDQEKCTGCGTCTSLCEEVFEMSGEKARVKKNVDFIKNKACIKEAKEACPTEAIGVNN